MPYSYAQYAGNGSTTTFSVPFPYLLKAHVKLYTGFNILTGAYTAELVEGTGFTWTSATQVQTTVAPASGATLTVIRRTPNSSRVVDWTDGSNLIAADLDTADLQNLYVVQEQQDRNDAGIAQSIQASADASAALAAAANALPYAPAANVAAIPVTAANNTRVEVADTTGIQSFSPLAGRPAGFIGSAQIKARLIYTTSGSTWNWVDYAVADPDGRYVLQSSISSSTASSSTTTVANSLAVKTAKDAADGAGVAAAAAQATANTAVTNAAAAQATANTAVTNAAAAQATANTAVTNAAAAQTTANAALPLTGGTLTGNLTVPSLNGGPLAGVRNLLINGNPIINQRGYVSGTATSGANEYTLDRWRVVTSGQSITWTDSANIRTVTAPAGGVEQVIEGLNILSGTYTLSWTGTATATVNGTAVAKGGQVTLTGGTNATVRFSGGTFSLAQLEVGTVATPFERKSYGQELALCQRYFSVSRVYGMGYAAGAGLYRVGVSFLPVTMRTIPTITFISATGSNVSGQNIESATEKMFGVFTNVFVAGNFYIDLDYTASAEL